MNVELTLKADIESGNAAFGDSHEAAYAELERILREALVTLYPINGVNSIRTLRDYNGNRIGRLTLHVEVTS